MDRSQATEEVIDAMAVCNGMEEEREACDLVHAYLLGLPRETLICEYRLRFFLNEQDLVRLRTEPLESAAERLHTFIANQGMRSVMHCLREATRRHLDETTDPEFWEIVESVRADMGPVAPGVASV